MALDGWRVFDWDDGVVDTRFALRPVAVGLAAGGPSFRETAARLELPAKSVLAGSLAALLYGAPVLFIANIFIGLRPTPVRRDPRGRARSSARSRPGG